jgi:predicted RNA binding protein YcfA (HicA-like mRNA interferase family)
VCPIAISGYGMHDSDDAFVTPSGIVGHCAHSSRDYLFAYTVPRAYRDAACLAWHLCQALRSNDAEMKVRQVLVLLERDGWHLVRTRGSHRQFKHPRKPGLVTIAGKESAELARGTVNSILKQAGLK